MVRRAAVLVLALLLAPLATVDAQTAPAAPGAPTPTTVTPVAPGVAALPGTPPAATPTPSTPSPPAPGNPSNPGDFTNNPYPTMPWFGVGSPYGQFVRWVWVPARAFAVGGRVVEQPGFWAAETTAGYYYVDHWALAQGPTGELSWRMVPRAFQPR
jgi:hypothetical protein